MLHYAARLARRLHLALPALALLALAPVAAGVGSLEAQDHDFLYVAVQDEAEVAVVDLETLEETARVDLTDLGFTENASPHHIAVDPDGSHWYVSLIGENRVLRFDRDNQLVGQAEFDVPGLMARHPASDRLYVGRSMKAVNPPRSIGEIDTGTMEVEPADVFFPRPHAIAVAPDAGRLFAASLAQNQMGSLDLASLGLELIDLEGPIHTLVQFAVSPDESTLVATAEMTGQLLVFDLADPSRPTLERSITVGTRPWHPVFEPGTSRVWFGVKGNDEVVAVDVERGEVVERISHPGIAAPHGAAISPDGRHLFVSSNGSDETTGTLAVIDLADCEVVKVLEMGTNATGIGTRIP